MKNLLIQYATVASGNKEPFKWQAAGMCYLIRSQAGRWIVVDGGFDMDAVPVIERLEAESEGVPEIDLWIITHPHSDHYGMLLETSRKEELRARLKVNRFCWCMPPESFRDSGRNISYTQIIRDVHSCAARFGVPEFHAVTGDVYRTDDLITEVLHTVEDLDFASDPNETSMAFRVTAAGQTILFLGDLYSGPSRKIAARYGAAMKSDFCQLAHHALNGGAEELYALVKPCVALVPMTRPAYETVVLSAEWQNDKGTRHNRNLLKTMRDEAIWLSADGDRRVELPFDFSTLEK